MKKLLLVLFCFATVALAQNNSAADDSPALTIYNQNFFVAREHVPLDLKSGVNQVSYTNVAAHLEPDSVILRDPGGRELQVLEQSYRNDPISQELLLSFYEGKTINFLVQRGDKQETISGKVIRSGYVPSSSYAQTYPQPTFGQPIIEIDGILRFGLPGQPLFPELTGDSILRPTLNWSLQTDAPGKSDAEISYVASGMTWQVDYNLVVSDQSSSSGKTDSLDMIGWVTMHNQSGKTFENARIKLLAGDVNKIENANVASRMYAAEAKAADMAMAPAVREKSFDEFHLYTLERPTTLRDNETKQVEFVRATGIKAQRIYVYDGARVEQYGYYNPDQIRQDANYGTASNPKVWVMEEFKNAGANHLGMALPKGKLRFYRRDTDGHLEFTGENVIDHTPKDETIRVYTGNSFDVVGERKRTNYHTDSSQHWMEESFEIRVLNHKKEAVNVRVVEHLYRWSNWKMVEESQVSRKTDAQTAEFAVAIPPDGEQVVNYTVHYSW